MSCAGLVPVAALPQRCGLAEVADRHPQRADRQGSHAGAKVSAWVVARADSIADIGLLRHGAMGTVFAARMQPLGSFLRAFTFYRSCSTARRLGGPPVGGQ